MRGAVATAALALVAATGSALPAAALAASPIASPAASGHELTLATWNIAWLRSAPLGAAEYERCRTLRREARDALDERDLMRWVCRSEEHYAQLRRVAAQLDADVVALQEVESVAAVERVFPPERYRAFVTESPWIQRTGFAVRRVAGLEVVRFAGYAELGQPMSDHPRFGADLTLRLADGRTLRVLAVHLKSACHARPLTDPQTGRYDKPGDRPPCHVLGDQVAPLETWIDARAREGVDFVVLGDFNRRLDSAVEREQAPRDAQGRQLTLWKEIDDGDPPGARLTRVTAGRQQIRNCQPGDRSLTAEERAMFIDHIVVGRSLAARIVPGSMRQWPLVEGKITRENREFVRALSDHCPLSVRLKIGDRPRFQN